MIKYRKVASSIPVYYSIFNYFWGTTNWDVLLTETCYYFFLQQSIKWEHFQSLLITTSFTIPCALFLQFSWQNGVKSFRAFLFMIYLIIILGDPFGSPEFCIFISKDWEKSDRNFWGSYILDDFGIDQM